MRTTKRFTPRVLERFAERGRGTGTYEHYIPWHCVTRSDPASRGRSHLIAWRGRHRHLLSDGELVAVLFATQILKKRDDLREQFPLSLEDAPHELAAYDAGHASRWCPGTVSIAKKLGIRHPETHGGGCNSLWVLTTDLLLMFYASDSNKRLLAVACKPTGTLGKRARELLTIEREYWICRGVAWLLITPSEYDLLVAQTLRNAWPWALGQSVDDVALDAARNATRRFGRWSLSKTLDDLALALGGMDLAQRALWQSVWFGTNPIDLRRGWRPHLPLHSITESDFWALNPVASRSSSWI